ncbi:hypothetical protein [Rhizobium rhizogenes]|uniref:Uncharacterized protein n=1 Tax=Rhizobium rhizogenes NBRC 13257 TaxID=1220581 RepID=A0AA87Q468_RHIRH|nr:hypothetical protein [Rhizobium rhizogenes]NTG67258.1 hypothetical protein [Rhizobium rhizogenes]TRB14308.1 hypothetical protein EXN67_01420 [Rhizobium rhizogenes]TRB47098.1 hypothetical protein EXN73_01420 [Rhizobium rhizogenes]TRB64865.1 hypothetical protein EXN71_01420 [Rhizobium rhizogenes]GAJ91049.1 hypothetical protein RRH01S_01_05200 [Rhizobium rhizogenes NBRC 13257]
MSTARSTSSRRFSKWLVAVNVLLAWAAIFLAIVYLQAAAVVASGFAFIGLVAGAYMGIGHADYRAFVRNAQPAPEVANIAGGVVAGGGDFPLVDTSSQEKT